MWRLQRSNDLDARFFQKMADEGHYQKAGGTRQGIYVCSPSGKLLSSINSLNPDHVLETIQLGLEKWRSLTEKEKLLPEGVSISTNHRWENSFPSGGLFLKTYNIDLFTDPPLSSTRSDRWNMDHVWFSSIEKMEWLPKEPNIGDIYTVPKNISDRLFRFHLVDNVRGQTLPFAIEEIKNGQIQIKVEAITKMVAKLSISGSSRAVAKGEWLMGENDWKPYYLLDHGMSTRLKGYAEVDLEKKKFNEFEMVALGFRYGVTENNARFSSPDSSFVGFLFTLDDKSDGNRIPPAFVDVYNADWILHP